MWDANGVPENHFELMDPFVPEQDGNVLIVARGRRADAIAAGFANARELEPLSVQIGGGRTRDYRLFVASGYRGTPDN
jgi:hypothetical protein